MRKIKNPIIKTNQNMEDEYMYPADQIKRRTTRKIPISRPIRRNINATRRARVKKPTQTMKRTRSIKKPVQIVEKK